VHVAGGIEGVMRSFPITACVAALACFAAVLLMSNGAAAQGSAQDRALIATYNASGQQLFKQFSKKPGNIVFSPYSIGAAMAMALSGARGETEAEMAGVLRHHQDRAQIDDANARVLAKLNGYAVPPCPADLKLIDDECRTPLPPSGVCPSGSEREGDLCVAPRTLASAKLLVANALMAVLPLIAKEYAETLKEKYAAEVFQGAKLEDVNGWVKRKTEDKIDKILARLDPRDVAVLLNAIYFKARWQDVFEPRATQEATFSLTNSQRIKVPMMQRIGYYYVVQRRGYRAIRLPYSVREIGMIVVVPDEVDGLKKVGNRLGAQELSEMFRAVQEEEKRIDLTMPRFKTTYDAGLKQPFKDLGMRMAFNSKQADFSGMTGRPPSDPRLFISEIIHRAVIDVTEEGTEAAAATAVIMRKGTGRAAPPEPFHIDRPFLYYIVDDATGAILFQGRIVDPR
jgi:leukocyte elastase inhibitor